MAQLILNNPDCLEITIHAWSAAAVQASLRGGVLDVINSTGSPFSDTVSISGAFSNEGLYATLEATTDEDEFTESIDGNVCISPKSRTNEILTINLNSCNGKVDELIRLKALKNRGVGGRDNLSVPLYVSIYDSCTGYSLVANQAWMLTNLTRKFGQDDTDYEVKFLLIEPRDNRLVSPADYDTVSAEVNVGVDTGFGGGFGVGN